MDITTLAQYGTAGVAIASIVAIIIIVKLFSKVLSNHINHNTKALTELTETNRGVKEVLKDLCRKM